MVERVRTAVFPVAGLGTRFLPATKAMPKEMLPVVDRPLIQYAVDEAREAGIEHFVFVTGRNKGVIEDHFDRQFELEVTLQERGKTEALAELRKDLPQPGRSSFTRQQEPLGLGHAVWCARELVGNNPFALLLPDMLMKAEPGALSADDGSLRAHRRQHHRHRGGRSQRRFLLWHPGARGRSRRPASRSPAWSKSPSPRMRPPTSSFPAAISCSPRFSSLLAKQTKGAGGEIQLTDAMLRLMDMQKFTGVKFEGQTFDCGSKIGFLTANVAYALDRPDIAEAFMKEVRQLAATATRS